MEVKDHRIQVPEFNVFTQSSDEDLIVAVGKDRKSSLDFAIWYWNQQQLLFVPHRLFLSSSLSIETQFIIAEHIPLKLVSEFDVAKLPKIKTDGKSLVVIDLSSLKPEELEPIIRHANFRSLVSNRKDSIFVLVLLVEAQLDTASWLVDTAADLLFWNASKPPSRMLSNVDKETNTKIYSEILGLNRWMALVPTSKIYWVNASTPATSSLLCDSYQDVKKTIAVELI
jgi:hypothetical protein